MIKGLDGLNKIRIQIVKHDKTKIEIKLKTEGPIVFVIYGLFSVLL